MKIEILLLVEEYQIVGRMLGWKKEQLSSRPSPTLFQLLKPY